MLAASDKDILNTGFLPLTEPCKIDQLHMTHIVILHAHVHRVYNRLIIMSLWAQRLDYHRIRDVRWTHTMRTHPVLKV